MFETICHAFLCFCLIQSRNTIRIGTPASTTSESFTSIISMKITIKIRFMLSRTTLISPLDSMSDTEFT